VKLFLDTRVLFAAAGSATGASRLLFDLREPLNLTLLTTHYCMAETARNLGKLPDEVEASRVWGERLVGGLRIEPDVWVHENPVIFPVPKDRPVLLSALASADWLLTLDRADFSRLLGDSVYHLRIATPAVFLRTLRDQEMI
jgi:predicted nucleic acid-binding protein